MFSITRPTSTERPCLQNLGTGEDIRDKFNETFEKFIFPAVKVSLLDSNLVGNDIEDSLCWLRNVMRRYVPHGKQKRGRLVEFAYSQLVPDAPEEQQCLARILGWCIEILQASFLIADDIMDNGITRRGRPCWYRENNMGNIAFNDALMLENVTYQLLRKFFSHLPLYTELVDLILRVSFQTTLGQSLDTRKSTFREFDQFSESMDYSIAQFKTGYYTFFLPIAAATYLAGYSRKETNHQKLWESVEKISLKMGILFQVQDDYMDFYSSEETLGKKGSDVEEGRCTYWLYVFAKKMRTADQFKTLTANYGLKDPDNVVKVKQLYEQLNIQKEFFAFRETYATHIMKAIEDVEHDQIRSVLNIVFQELTGR